MQAKKSRKIYFSTFRNLLAFMEKALQMQGFNGSRLAQYELLNKVANFDTEESCERYLVRHKLTGKLFKMKKVSEHISAVLY